MPSKRGLPSESEKHEDFPLADVQAISGLFSLKALATKRINYEESSERAASGMRLKSRKGGRNGMVSRFLAPSALESLQRVQQAHLLERGNASSLMPIDFQQNLTEAHVVG